MTAEREGSPESLPFGKVGEIKAYIRDDMRDLFERYFKDANYLLVANATGFVTCLAALKDYSPTGIYKGIGVFIALFAAGLLTAICGLVLLRHHRSGMLTWITHGGEKPPPMVAPLYWLAASLFCVVSAIIIIAVRFAPL